MGDRANHDDDREDGGDSAPRSMAAGGQQHLLSSSSAGGALHQQHDGDDEEGRSGGGGAPRRIPLIQQCLDWWYYFRRSIIVPTFGLYPSGVVPNWNDKFYKDPRATERVRRREQRSYKARYEGNMLFRWLFWRERQGRVRMSIHNPLMPASEEAVINQQAYIEKDPFVFGENVAGHPDEVCIGKGPYAVRLEKPLGFRLCLYTGRPDGDEEEFDIGDDEE